MGIPRPSRLPLRSARRPSIIRTADTDKGRTVRFLVTVRVASNCSQRQQWKRWCIHYRLTVLATTTHDNGSLTHDVSGMCKLDSDGRACLQFVADTCPLFLSCEYATSATVQMVAVGSGTAVATKHSSSARARDRLREFENSDSLRMQCEELCLTLYGANRSLWFHHMEPSDREGLLMWLSAPKAERWSIILDQHVEHCERQAGKCSVRELDGEDCQAEWHLWERRKEAAIAFRHERLSFGKSKPDGVPQPLDPAIARRNDMIAAMSAIDDALASGQGTDAFRKRLAEQRQQLDWILSK